MHATIRRYEGVDQNRTVELTGKVNETLVPKLNKLEGFKGYYMFEDADGVISAGLFETSGAVRRVDQARRPAGSATSGSRRPSRTRPRSRAAR